MAGATSAASVDAGALGRLLDGRYGELREQIRQVLASPEFERPLAPGTEEYRELVLDWARRLATEGMTAPGFPPEFGGRGDPGANVASFETLAFGDLSLLVKLGVQFGLWGGAVLHLGTRIHHERYLRDTASLALPGCFAMTEAGHGSNVQQLQTTATYDPDSQSFVSTRRAMRRARSTSATPPVTPGWPPCSRSWSSGASVTAFTPWWCRCATRRDGCALECGSRTAARRWASTASTTAASGSTTSGWRARRCSTATATSAPRASTRAPSRAPTAASSR